MKVVARLFCMLLAFTLAKPAVHGGGLQIESFDGAGRLSFNTLDDGTNYNYRVEWASTAGGPWNEFGSAGSHWLNAKPQPSGASVTNLVPMFYRVVATPGDYMAIDVSEGPDATSYPVTYYRTLAEVPGGPNSDVYKTTTILMRLIPKGTFTMGSPPGELGRWGDETQRQVTLTQDYYLGVFQVTQRQWERVMGNWPSWFSNTDYRDTRPVERVSYYDIRENPDNSAISPNWPQSSQVHLNSFMGRLRAKTGLSTLDLPTEAQREYACRAGTGAALNSGKNLTSQFSCPNMHELGRYYHNHPGGYSSSSSVSTDGGTAKVGSYLPNAWGLYDMHGNVWEWCLDWYEMYHAATTDPAGAASESDRVGRGGVWIEEAGSCRSAYRNYGSPGSRSSARGLRLSRTLP